MAGHRAAIWGFVLVEATALLTLAVNMGSIGGALFLLVAALLAAPLLLLLFLSLIGHPGVGICLLLALGFGCDVLWRCLAPEVRRPVSVALLLSWPFTGIATLAAISNS